MCSKSFHKLCGFQGIHTNVMWARRRGKKTPWEWGPWGGVTQKGGRQGVGWNVHENTRQQPNTSDCNCWALSSSCMVRNSCDAHKHARAHTCTHNWTIRRMLTATVPYAPSVLRGNVRNGTGRNFRYLQQSFTFLLVKEFKLLLFCETSETHSSTSAALLYQRSD